MYGPFGFAYELDCAGFSTCLSRRSHFLTSTVARRTVHMPEDVLIVFAQRILNFTGWITRVVDIRFKTIYVLFPCSKVISRCSLLVRHCLRGLGQLL